MGFFCFLKIFNNFESNYSTKQLRKAVSSFPQKSLRYLTTRIFVGQNISEPLNCTSFLSDGSAINLMVLEIQVKSVYVFL